MDSAASLDSLAADPRQDRRRILTAFAERVAMEARTVAIPKLTPSAIQVGSVASGTKRAAAPVRQASAAAAAPAPIKPSTPVSTVGSTAAKYTASGIWVFVIVLVLISGAVYLLAQSRANQPVAEEAMPIETLEYAPPVLIEAPPPPPPPPRMSDIDAFEEARHSVRGLQQFIREYPQSPYVTSGQAQLQINQLEQYGGSY